MSMLLRRHHQENKGEETPRPAPVKDAEVKEEAPKKRTRKPKGEG